MKMKISSVIGLLVIVAMLMLPLVTFAGANTAAVARKRPSGGGGGSSGIGTAGPASKAGADGVVKKYALCVGVSDYKDPSVNDLQYCDDDARDWASYFQSKGYSVKTLIDSQATEAGVENALFGIIATADADDQIVFATSGHGTTASRMQVLLYYDLYGPATDGDGFVSGVVPDKELYNWFAKTTSKVCIIVDHCNSGGLNEVTSGHTNLILQTTCGATGYGYDVPDYNNGAFTYWYCHQALQGQGFTDAESAFAWVKAHYPYGGKDAPCQFDCLSGNFVF